MLCSYNKPSIDQSKEKTNQSCIFPSQENPRSPTTLKHWVFIVKVKF